MNNIVNLYSEDELIRTAFRRVTTEGIHLSGAINTLFRTIKPTGEHSRRVRNTLYAAVRYGDIDGAMAGRLNGVINLEKAAFPPWLRTMLENEYGKAFKELGAKILVDPPTFVRVNTLKTDPVSCFRALRLFGPELVNENNTIIKLLKPYGLFRSKPYLDGWIEQQDVNSQLASSFLPLKPGMRVVDYCAGSGGKALHMAMQMQNKGKILALDISITKLEQLSTRAARAGASLIETRHIDTTKVVKRMAETADAVLVDAPCSGTGVLGRNPDILYHLTEESLAELCEMQSEVLSRGFSVLKPGGNLLYITCSLLPQECQDQIVQFLERFPNAKLESEHRLLPTQNDGDGFYCALISKVAAPTVEVKTVPAKKSDNA